MLFGLREVGWSLEEPGIFTSVLRGGKMGFGDLGLREGTCLHS